MSDNANKLGKLIQGTGERDAVHIAIMPVTANGKLQPGDHVGLIDGKADNRVPSGRCIGVVDPFLKTAIKEGQVFYLCLYPGSITSLRHEWTHPDIPEAKAQETVDVAEAKVWLENLAANLHMSYEELMAAADRWILRGDYTYENTESYKDYFYGNEERFWKCFDIVRGGGTGRSDSFFTCAC